MFTLFSEWMWLLGNNVGNQLTYFEHGVKASPRTETNAHDVVASYPGSRAGAAFWADHSGEGWMFGGIGFSQYDSEHAHILQDLWSFSVLRNEWTLINAGSTGAVSSQGERHPGPRHNAAACGVHHLAFTTFGGEDQAGRLQNDTWVFDIPNKVWLPLLKFGPASRSDMAYWCDKSKIVIFGGEGGNNIMLGDMWEFSLRYFKWTKVEPKSSSVPLGRSGAMTWRELSGNLYMYGGQRIEKEEHGVKRSFLSDLWLFNMKNQSWHLVNGDVTGQQKLANYGNLGISYAKNTPGPRMHSATWVVEDTLWLYGGLGCGDGTNRCHIHSMLADLWMFNLTNLYWMWQGGSKRLDLPPEFGEKGHSASNNSPGSRSGSVAWSHEGVAFLFGGIGQDGRYRTSFLNDLWILGKTNKKYVFTTAKSWLHGIQPGLVFLMVLASIAGIALSFGAIFFLKKMMEYSRHRTSSGDFKVRYSPISQEATLET